VAAPSTPDITSTTLEGRKPRVSKGLPILLGLAVGGAAVAWVPWQFVAIALCILFVFALARYFTAQVKLPTKISPERAAKVEENKTDRAN